ncbi:sensor histidine kinase [Thalassospira lucentensis]|uniref:sensor histidine kinase n=1 Tax=Thalassospira lucentensis TaxID=168935 RepID=UPI0003B3A4BF|nr:HAMP domain-containing sensor histidine kinase [Thalassospira lucentensis]RCK28694.1 hypothetical protein TH1_09515 [Thalassospira lucentensis MCCC 1A00383 = DSM 14000]
MFGVELDIRTLAFIATLSAIVQALAFTALSFVTRRGNGAEYWAIGGICAAIGFVLLGFRSVIPDLASVILANILIAASHGLYWLGLQKYTRREPSFVSFAAPLVLVAVLFVYFTNFAPNIAARIMVISGVLAVFSLTSFKTLWFRGRVERTAPESLMAITFAAHGIFHTCRVTYTWLEHQEIASFMAASSIHMVAFLDVIFFLLLTAVGFTGMIIISLNGSLLAEMKAKNRLFTVLAHDLRTPFSGLAGISLLAQQDLVAGNQAHALANIRLLHTSTSETQRFLDDLLIWGRTLFEDEKPARSEINLDLLVENTLKILRPLIEAKSIKIEFDKRGLSGFGITHHAEMICRNLIVNAIKFSNPRSSISISTAIAPEQKADKSTDKIVIRICDNGAGASDEMIAGFSRGTASYASTSGTSGEKGSGVGLSLCRDLCREDGQEIWLEHNPTGGMIACFTISAQQPETVS